MYNRIYAASQNSALQLIQHFFLRLFYQNSVCWSVIKDKIDYQYKRKPENETYLWPLENTA